MTFRSDTPGRKREGERRICHRGEFPGGGGGKVLFWTTGEKFTAGKAWEGRGEREKGNATPSPELRSKRVDPGNFPQWTGKRLSIAGLSSLFRILGRKGTGVGVGEETTLLDALSPAGGTWESLALVVCWELAERIQKEELGEQKSRSDKCPELLVEDREDG